MAEVIVDLIGGATLPLTGVGPIIDLKSQEAQALFGQGTFKGNTPYRGDAILEVVSTAGTIAIYGIQRPNPNMGGKGTFGQYSQAFKADGTAATFLTKFDYAAFSLHNWVVQYQGKYLTYDATPADLTEFKVTDVGGKLEITIGDGDPLPYGDVNVFKASSLKKTILASGANTNVKKLVSPTDLLYIEGSAWNGSRADLQFVK